MLVSLRRKDVHLSPLWFLWLCGSVRWADLVFAHATVVDNQPHRWTLLNQRRPYRSNSHHIDAMIDLNVTYPRITANLNIFSKNLTQNLVRQSTVEPKNALWPMKWSFLTVKVGLCSHFVHSNRYRLCAAIPSLHAIFAAAIVTMFGQTIYIQMEREEKGI